MGEIKFMTGLTMTILFAIAISAYAFSFASDNDAVVTLESDDQFVDLKTDLEGNASYFLIQDINDSSNAFYKSTIESGDDTMGGGGAFKVGLGTLVTTINSILGLTKKYLFGGSNAFGLFLGAISGLLIYTGIRYIYKTWVGKNPD